jgi:hypothetical protein
VKSSSAIEQHPRHRPKKTGLLLLLLSVLLFTGAAGLFLWTHSQLLGYEAIAANVTPHGIVTASYEPTRRPSSLPNTRNGLAAGASPTKPGTGSSAPAGNYVPPPSALLPSDVFSDGQLCSVGCRPAGAIPGWPLKPWHEQHPLRAGINELRSSSLHHCIDIQARNGARVYAIQPGTVSITVDPGNDARIQVGNYVYWHVNPTVTDGEYVLPYQTVLGTVKNGFGHICFGEVGPNGNDLNPLRPGGRVLSPYVDAKAPVISAPTINPDGFVSVVVRDPQSFVRKTTYWTPDIAPAVLAYRLWSTDSAPLSPLYYALRGSQNLPWSEEPSIYMPDSHGAGFTCFETKTHCPPHWDYKLAGGLAPAITDSYPVSAAGPFRLTVYAWDWAGNVSARDVWLHFVNGNLEELRSISKF